MDIHHAELGEIQALMKKELCAIYPEEEALAITNSLIFHLKGYSRGQIVINKNELLTESDIYFLQRSIKRLLLHEPLQYITGLAYFFGNTFKVDPSVLIPRPETEELLKWVIDDAIEKAGLHLLDIGTGSGCIAISLAKMLNNPKVDAIDISAEALDLAQYNAGKLGAKVGFMRIDILDERQCSALSKYDVIISNPPYVTPSDKDKMLPNVTDHEPSIALFVSEDDPLIFYREIIRFAQSHLNEGGKLYFECNEAFAGDVVKLLTKEGFRHTEIRHDMQGKPRMVLGVVPRLRSG